MVADHDESLVLVIYSCLSVGLFLTDVYSSFVVHLFLYCINLVSFVYACPIVVQFDVFLGEE